jgi:hypothetical protein
VLSKAHSGAFKEGVTKSIDLSEDGEDCVQAMIEYFYKFEHDAVDTLPHHVSMAVLADRYNISYLGDNGHQEAGSSLRCHV